MARHRNHVRIDDRGFFVHTSEAPWQPWHRDHRLVRRGLPWSPAEDRYLLRRVRELEEADQSMDVLMMELQRNGCAITTRLSSLRAGLRLAALAALDPA